jgi:hypothetical protein
VDIELRSNNKLGTDGCEVAALDLDLKELPNVPLHPDFSVNFGAKNAVLTDGQMNSLPTVVECLNRLVATKAALENGYDPALLAPSIARLTMQAQIGFRSSCYNETLTVDLGFQDIMQQWEVNKNSLSEIVTILINKIETNFELGLWVSNDIDTKTNISRDISFLKQLGDSIDDWHSEDIHYDLAHYQPKGIDDKSPRNISSLENVFWETLAYAERKGFSANFDLVVTVFNSKEKCLAGTGSWIHEPAIKAVLDKLKTSREIDSKSQHDISLHIMQLKPFISMSSGLNAALTNQEVINIQRLYHGENALSKQRINDFIRDNPKLETAFARYLPTESECIGWNKENALSNWIALRLECDFETADALARLDLNPQSLPSVKSGEARVSFEVSYKMEEILQLLGMPLRGRYETYNLSVSHLPQSFYKFLCDSFDKNNFNSALMIYFNPENQAHGMDGMTSLFELFGTDSNLMARLLQRHILEEAFLPLAKLASYAGV